MGKVVNRHSTDEETQMANTHTETCLTSLTIRKMQIKSHNEVSLRTYQDG